MRYVSSSRILSSPCSDFAPALQVLDAIAALFNHWRTEEDLQPVLSAFNMRALIGKEQMLLFKSTVDNTLAEPVPAAAWSTSIASIMTEVAAVSQQPMLQSILELFEPSPVLHDVALLLLNAAMATEAGEKEIQKQAGLLVEVS